MNTSRNSRMRSRILLLFSLIVALFLVAAVPLSVNLKYRSGNFRSGDKTIFDELPLQPFAVLSIKNLNNCYVVTADSFRMEVAQPLSHWIMQTTKNDTLTISLEKYARGDSSMVIIYAPRTTKIMVASSMISLCGSGRQGPKVSYSVELQDSKLNIPGNPYHLFFAEITVHAADSSRVTIGKNNHVEKLSLLNVSNARFPSSAPWKLNSDFQNMDNVNVSYDGDDVTIRAKRK